MAISDDKLLLLMAILIRRRRRRRGWRKVRSYVRPINLKRLIEGEFVTLVTPMRLHFPDDHFAYLRMSATRFEDLLRRVGPLITHAGTHRFPISADQRLTLTLRYLANGGSLGGLAFSYRIGQATASMIIQETTKAIWAALKDEFLKPPSCQEWKRIADEFWRKWNFPLCVGAVDGKHIAIRNPKDGGSLYYNYKNFFSIVLLAVVDANYKFVFIDVGGFGSEGDATLFPLSAFGKRIDDATKTYEDGGLDFPADAHLPGTTIKCPHVLLGDEAFGLRRHLLRPYSRRSARGLETFYNYRHSRARRIVENGYGIWSTRWRALECRSNLSVETVEEVVKATICLHNYLKSTDAIDSATPRYVPVNYVDYEMENGEVVRGDWRQGEHNYELLPLPPETSPERVHYANREKFKNFFVSEEGSIPWQYDMVGRGEY